MTKAKKKVKKEKKIEAPIVTPKSVLEGAKEANYKEVIVIGISEDNTIGIATTLGDYAAISWVLDMMKKMILENGSTR